MSADLIPYEYNPTTRQPLAQGVFCGVHIVVDEANLDWLLERFERWFQGRSEIIQVDNGTSDKQGLGFVILEWETCMIDPLFIAILKDDERIVDYTLYQRTEEV